MTAKLALHRLKCVLTDDRTRLKSRKVPLEWYTSSFIDRLKPVSILEKYGQQLQKVTARTKGITSA